MTTLDSALTAGWYTYAQVLEVLRSWQRFHIDFIFPMCLQDYIIIHWVRVAMSPCVLYLLVSFLLSSLSLFVLGLIQIDSSFWVHQSKQFIVILLRFQSPLQVLCCLVFLHRISELSWMPPCYHRCISWFTLLLALHQKKKISKIRFVLNLKLSPLFSKFIQGHPLYANAINTSEQVKHCYPSCNSAP